MIKKKICMLGAFAVGKTSLVRRFVSSIFDEKYHKTVGVKIDQKDLKVGDNDVTLLLWDLLGEDEFHTVSTTYMKGSSGYLLVLDGTRKNTYENAEHLHDLMKFTAGDIPFICLINKSDLMDEWEIDARFLREIRNKWPVIITSAKTGEGVENAFQQLAEMMVNE